MTNVLALSAAAPESESRARRSSDRALSEADCRVSSAMPVDPIAVADLSEAADPIGAVDPIAAEDPNAEGDHCVGEPHTAARSVAVADRDGEAVHTAAQNVAGVDLNAVADHYEAAARIAARNAVVAAPSAPAAPNAAVVLRSAVLALNGVRNVATNAVQIFPSVQHDRVSLVLPEDPKARNVALRSAALHC